MNKLGGVLVMVLTFLAGIVFTLTFVSNSNAFAQRGSTFLNSSNCFVQRQSYPALLSDVSTFQRDSLGHDVVKKSQILGALGASAVVVQSSKNPNVLVVLEYITVCK